MKSLNDEQAQDGAGTGSGKKNNSFASRIANEMKLRRLIREKQGVVLKNVAVQVLANEGGSKSEEINQIFAMLWYVTPTDRERNREEFQD